jgi:hypothetical protein
LHFDGADLNQCARRLLNHIDLVVGRLRNQSEVSLGTIELDVEPGRFPELLVSFFNDPSWDYSTRFCVGTICKSQPNPAYEVGQLVFEMRPGQLARLLSLNGGWRWGAGLRLGGLHLPDSDVAIAIKGSPFDPEHAARLERLAKSAWAASADMDHFSAWVSADSPELRHLLTGG